MADEMTSSPWRRSVCGADVYCGLCLVTFNSRHQAVQHYTGKTHCKRLRRTDRCASSYRPTCYSFTQKDTCLSASFSGQPA